MHRDLRQIIEERVRPVIPVKRLKITVITGILPAEPSKL